MKNYALLTASLPRSHCFPWTNELREIERRWNSMHFVRASFAGMAGENTKTRWAWRKMFSRINLRPPTNSTLAWHCPLPDISLHHYVVVDVHARLVNSKSELPALDRRSMICFEEWWWWTTAIRRWRKVWNNNCNKFKIKMRRYKKINERLHNKHSPASILFFLIDFDEKKWEECASS